MGQLGDLLRETREAKGLSLEQVELATRIRSKLLESLEQEAYDELPAPVFVKGFLRNYAQLLELDVAHVLALYKDAAGDAEIPYELHALREPLEREPARWPALLATIALLFVILGGSWYLNQRDLLPIPDLGGLLGIRATATPTSTALPPATATPTTPAPPTITPVPTRTRTQPAATSSATPTAVATQTGTTAPDNTTTPLAEPTATRTTAPPTRTASLTKTVVPSPTRTSSVTPSPSRTTSPTRATVLASATAPTTGIGLQLDFTADVWLRIYVDGVKVYEGMVEKGEQRTYVANAQVYVHAGVASAVLATINGQEHGPLGPEPDTIRIEWTLAPGTPSVVSPIAPTQIVLPSASANTATPTPRR